MSNERPTDSRRLNAVLFGAQCVRELMSTENVVAPFLARGYRCNLDFGSIRGRLGQLLLIYTVLVTLHTLSNNCDYFTQWKDMKCGIARSRVA